jgi:diacylglycerol kinase family enzyme
MSTPGPVALIINPAATRARTTDRTDITRVLAPFGLEWTLTTESAGHATELTRRVVDEGARVVVTLGGDGTAAEVAAVLGGGPVAMVALPGGNANVYARASGWPSSLPHALPVLAAALAGGWRGASTLGQMVLDGETEHTFLTNAGVGIDAATVEWVEARPRLKRRARRAGFALAAVLSAGRAIRGPRLHVSDGRVTVDAITALVASASPYTYLGPRPLDLVPGAGQDGRVAWVALTRLRPIELAALMAKALAGGTPDLGRPPLRGGPLTGELVVTAARPVPVQADGEPLGHHREVRVRAGDTLTVVDPRGGAGLKSGGLRPT